MKQVMPARPEKGRDCAWRRFFANVQPFTRSKDGSPPFFPGGLEWFDTLFAFQSSARGYAGHKGET